MKCNLNTAYNAYNTVNNNKGDKSIEIVKERSYGRATNENE